MDKDGSAERGGSPGKGSAADKGGAAYKGRTPDKDRTLGFRNYARLAELPLDQLAAQCETDVFHATGPGGQGVNTTDSAVRMRHVPTGIVVVSRESRSQYRNRQLCLQKLRAELRRRAVPPKVRRATKPTHGSVVRRLEEKRIRSGVKARRRPVNGEE